MRWSIVLVMICICKFTLASNPDYAVWSFVGANKKISKIVNLYGELEYRSRAQVSETDCWAAYAELSAKVFPFLRMGGGYTYIHYNHPSLSWEPRHRLNLFATGNYTYQNWTFAIRERYEAVFRMLTDNSKPNPKPKQTLRSRIELNYKVPSSIIAPYATIEAYTVLNASKGIEHEKVRYTLGTQLHLSKVTSLTLYYRYIDAALATSVDSHILGLGARFNL